MTTRLNRIKYGKLVLKRYETDKIPFVLFLRSFQMTMFHGQYDEEYLLENHLWTALDAKGIDIITLVNQREVDNPSWTGHGAPAISVGNDEWEKVVIDLISKSEMIISEATFLRPAVVFELEECAKKKIFNTIVITPPPDSPFEATEDIEPVKKFLRVLYFDEIPDSYAIDHFIFKDLLQHMYKLVGLSRTNRIKLAKEKNYYKRYGQPLDGLFEGYYKMAFMYERKHEFHRAMRSYYRSIKVASALANYKGIVSASQKYAKLAIHVGDYKAALNYLEGGKKYSQLIDDSFLFEWFENEISFVKDKLKQ